jgi:hypothetical protein
VACHNNLKEMHANISNEGINARNPYK